MKNFIKYISLMLSFVFTVTTVAWSAPSCYQVTVSEDIGRVKKRYKGEGSKLVIHVQDAHTSFEAQKNLAQIICELIPTIQTADHRPQSTENNTADRGQRAGDAIPFIGIEGAIGSYDLSRLRTIPLDEAKQAMADEYVKEGKFLGAELASIISDQAFSLYGLESRDLFTKNFREFYRVAKLQANVQEELALLESAVAELKMRIYSAPLHEFDSVVEDYEQTHNSLLDVTAVIFKHMEMLHIPIENYISLCQFQEIIQLGSGLDNELLDGEIEKARADYNEQTATQIVNQQFERMRKGTIDKREFVRFLIGQLDGLFDDAEKRYPLLERYCTYWRKYALIDFSLLLNEVSSASYEIRKGLAYSDEEKTLVDAEYHMSVLKRLMSLKAVKDEVQTFRAAKDDFSLTNIYYSIKPLLGADHVYAAVPDAATNKRLLAAIEAFYDAADARDDVLVHRLLDQMTNSEQDVGVLVAGGYHSEGIENKLKANNISFLTVTPHITQVTEDVAYADRMLGGIVPIDPRFTGSVSNSQLTASLQAIAELGFQHILDEFQIDVTGYAALTAQDIERLVQRLSEEGEQELADAFKQIYEEGLIDDAVSRVVTESEPSTNLASTLMREIRQQLGKEVLEQRSVAAFLLNMEKALEREFMASDASSTSEEQPPTLYSDYFMRFARVGAWDLLGGPDGLFATALTDYANDVYHGNIREYSSERIMDGDELKEELELQGYNDEDIVVVKWLTRGPTGLSLVVFADEYRHMRKYAGSMLGTKEAWQDFIFSLRFELDIKGRFWFHEIFMQDDEHFRGKGISSEIFRNVFRLLSQQWPGVEVNANCINIIAAEKFAELVGAEFHPYTADFNTKCINLLAHLGICTPDESADLSQQSLFTAIGGGSKKGIYDQFIALVHRAKIAEGMISMSDFEYFLLKLNQYAERMAATYSKTAFQFKQEAYNDRKVGFFVRSFIPPWAQLQERWAALDRGKHEDDVRHMESLRLPGKDGTEPMRVEREWETLTAMTLYDDTAVMAYRRKAVAHYHSRERYMYREGINLRNNKMLPVMFDAEGLNDANFEALKQAFRTEVLRMSDEEQQRLWEAAEERMRERNSPYLLISILQDSTYLFEDHRKNGFIGVNAALFSSSLSRQTVRRLLRIGLRHELQHETGNDDEDVLFDDDVSYAQGIGVTADDLRLLQALVPDSPLVHALETLPLRNRAHEDIQRFIDEVGDPDEALSIVRFAVQSAVSLDAIQAYSCEKIKTNVYRHTFCVNDRWVQCYTKQYLAGNVRGANLAGYERWVQGEYAYATKAHAYGLAPASFVCEVRGMKTLVYQPARGDSLRDIMSAHSSVFDSERDGVAIAQEIAYALGKLHGLGILHRDIYASSRAYEPKVTSDHIFIARTGNEIHVQFIDFDISIAETFYDDALTAYENERAGVIEGLCNDLDLPERTISGLHELYEQGMRESVHATNGAEPALTSAEISQTNVIGMPLPTTINNLMIRRIYAAASEVRRTSRPTDDCIDYSFRLEDMLRRRGIPAQAFALQTRHDGHAIVKLSNGIIIDAYPEGVQHMGEGIIITTEAEYLRCFGTLIDQEPLLPELLDEPSQAILRRVPMYSLPLKDHSDSMRLHRNWFNSGAETELNQSTFADYRSNVINYYQTAKPEHVKTVTLDNNDVRVIFDIEGLSNEERVRVYEMFQLQISQMSDAEQLVLLSEAQKRMEKLGETMPTLVISVLNSSPYMFEDHKANGFIGINRALFTLSTTLQEKLLRLGFRHELWHEMGVANSHEDESMLFSGDITYISKLGITEAEMDELRGICREHSWFLNHISSREPVITVFTGRNINPILRHVGQSYILGTDSKLGTIVDIRGIWDLLDGEGKEKLLTQIITVSYGAFEAQEPLSSYYDEIAKSIVRFLTRPNHGYFILIDNDGIVKAFARTIDKYDDETSETFMDVIASDQLDEVRGRGTFMLDTLIARSESRGIDMFTISEIMNTVSESVFRSYLRRRGITNFRKIGDKFGSIKIPLPITSDEGTVNTDRRFMQSLPMRDGRDEMNVRREWYREAEETELTQENMEAYRLNALAYYESEQPSHVEPVRLDGEDISVVFDIDGLTDEEYARVRAMFLFQINQMSDAEQRALLSAAQARMKALGEQTPAIIISVLENSPYLFEDHRQNGFIGINRALFKLHYRLQEKILKLGFRHELQHEMGVDSKKGTEKKLLLEDIAYAKSLTFDYDEMNALSALTTPRSPLVLYFLIHARSADVIRDMLTSYFKLDKIVFHSNGKEVKNTEPQDIARRLAIEVDNQMEFLENSLLFAEPDIDYLIELALGYFGDDYYYAPTFKKAVDAHLNYEQWQLYDPQVLEQLKTQISKNITVTKPFVISNPADYARSYMQTMRRVSRKSINEENDYAAAYEHMVELVKAERVIDESEFLNMFQIMSQHIEDDRSGYRRSVIESDGWYFIMPEEVERSMQELFEWLWSPDTAEMNVLDMVGEFVFRCMRIHPFANGNKRLALLMANYLLMRNGYPPVLVNDDNAYAFNEVVRFMSSGSDVAAFLAQEIMRQYTGNIDADQGDSTMRIIGPAYLEINAADASAVFDIYSKTGEPVLSVSDEQLVKEALRARGIDIDFELTIIDEAIDDGLITYDGRSRHMNINGTDVYGVRRAKPGYASTVQICITRSMSEYLSLHPDEAIAFFMHEGFDGSSMSGRIVDHRESWMLTKDSAADDAVSNNRIRRGMFNLIVSMIDDMAETKDIAALQRLADEYGMYEREFFGKRADGQWDDLETGIYQYVMKSLAGLQSEQVEEQAPVETYSTGAFDTSRPGYGDFHTYFMIESVEPNDNVNPTEIVVVVHHAVLDDEKNPVNTTERHVITRAEYPDIFEAAEDMATLKRLVLQVIDQYYAKQILGTSFEGLVMNRAQPAEQAGKPAIKKPIGIKVDNVKSVVETEALISELLRGIGLRQPKITVDDEYGYVEFIQNKKLDVDERYELLADASVEPSFDLVEQLGYWAAALFLLQNNDVTWDNLLLVENAEHASGYEIIPVDHENVFTWNLSVDEYLTLFLEGIFTVEYGDGYKEWMIDKAKASGIVRDVFFRGFQTAAEMIVRQRAHITSTIASAGDLAVREVLRNTGDYPMELIPHYSLVLTSEEIQRGLSQRLDMLEQVAQGAVGMNISDDMIVRVEENSGIDEQAILSRVYHAVDEAGLMNYANMRSAMSAAKTQYAQTKALEIVYDDADTADCITSGELSFLEYSAQLYAGEMDITITFVPLSKFDKKTARQNTPRLFLVADVGPKTESLLRDVVVISLGKRSTPESPTIRPLVISRFHAVLNIAISALAQGERGAINLEDKLFVSRSSVASFINNNPLLIAGLQQALVEHVIKIAA